MGQAVLEAAKRSEDIVVSALWTRRDELPEAGGALLSSDLGAVLEAADVAIDFTLPEATPAIADGVRKVGVPLVSGVTGLGAAEMDRLREASATVPVLHDRNMSLGVTVLTELVGRAAAALGPGFLAHIHEIHHVHKRDAPSGTALKLGEALARGRGQDFGEVCRYIADEREGRRAPDEIVITAARRGEVMGEHEVSFASGSERLVLGHSVTDRAVFAEGAVAAACWLLRQPPGFYRMSDLLGRDA